MIWKRSLRLATASVVLGLEESVCFLCCFYITCRVDTKSWVVNGSRDSVGDLTDIRGRLWTLHYTMLQLWLIESWTQADNMQQWTTTLSHTTRLRWYSTNYVSNTDTAVPVDCCYHRYLCPIPVLWLVTTSWTRTVGFGPRGFFSVAGPSLWNTLPIDMKLSTLTAAPFRSHPKNWHVPRRIEGWVDLSGWLHSEMVYPPQVVQVLTEPGIEQLRRRSRPMRHHHSCVITHSLTFPLTWSLRQWQ